MTASRTVPQSGGRLFSSIITIQRKLYSTLKSVVGTTYIRTTRDLLESNYETTILFNNDEVQYTLIFGF